MELTQELHRVAEAALDFASPSEDITAVIPTEPGAGSRVYLCAFGEGERRTWLALDAEGRALHDRALVRDAVSIAALCELAEETAGRADEPGMRVATPAYLDEIGAALTEEARVSFTEAMRAAMAAVDELLCDVEASYRGELT